MEEPCPPRDAVSTGVVGVVKELVAGTVGGCAGIVAGQPLDTIKVRRHGVEALLRRAGSSVSLRPRSCACRHPGAHIGRRCSAL